MLTGQNLRHHRGWMTVSLISDVRRLRRLAGPERWVASGALLPDAIR